MASRLTRSAQLDHFNIILIEGERYLSIFLYMLSQSRKEDIRSGAQMHRTKKIERIKSKIGEVKKLKDMLWKRLKIVKNKCCGIGHEM